jgi:hypothetical protein
MSAECIPGHARLEVRDHLVVEIRADRVVAVGKVDPGADVVPNAVGVVQDGGGIFVQRICQVVLLAEAVRVAEMSHQRLAVEKPRKFSRVVDQVEAELIPEQVALEAWDRGQHLIYRYVGHIDLRAARYRFARYQAAIWCP